MPSRLPLSLCLMSLLTALTFGQTPSTSDVLAGEWTLNPSVLPDRVEFSLQGSPAEGRHFSTNSSWLKSDLKGLDWSTPAKHDVRFTVARDAGTLDCEGFVKGGAGAGLFEFRANTQYSAQLAALGFPGVTADRQFAFAIHDVSLSFVREIKALNISGLDSGKLLAFRIHGVTPEFIRAIRAAGLRASEADKLIAFRIHGVSPEFVNNLRAAGIKADDSDKLVAFRIHGVSPEFVNELGKLGYGRPAADQLIALRIHGVTPEYIAKLRARGVQNLTLEQLVSLRIHGID
jgi:hypothetical protein